MNLKKIFAGAMSLAMALSTVNFSYAEPTGKFVDVGGKFAANQGNFDKRTNSKGTVTWTNEKYYGSEDTGALKFEANSEAEAVNGSLFLERKFNKNTELENGETYLIKAYVYGEKIKNTDTAYAYLGMDNDWEWGDLFKTGFEKDTRTAMPYKWACSEKKILKQGEWTELSTYYISNTDDWKRLVIKIGDVNNCITDGDVYYIDNITFEKQSNADDFFNAISGGPKTKFDKTVTADYGFSAFDITETKHVLTVGERTDLVAYLQDNTKKTAAEIETSRTKADLSKITVSSDDSDIADFVDGKIVAKACGNAVLNVTYADGDTKQTGKILVTVHPGNSNSFVMDNDGASYAKITDPLNKNNNARIAYDSVQTNIPANKPITASFRVYYTGVKAINNWNSRALGQVGVLFNTNPTESAYVAGGNYVDRFVEVEYRDKTGGWINADGTISQVDGTSQSRKMTFNAGWNNVDIVTDYPKMGLYKDNYMSVKFYVNGTEVTDEWLYGNLSNLKEIKVNPSKNISFSGFSQIAMVDDISVVSMDEALKVSTTNPAVGEKLSTLDDIDVKFNTQATVSDVDNCAALYQGDVVVDTVKVISSDKKKLSVIPQGGLKPNTEYTLRLAAEKFTDTLGNTLTGTTEFSFVTNNVKISDVIGSGYKLLNSQINMIENGMYTLSNSAEKLSGNVLHLPSQKDTPQYNAIRLTADDSFKTEKITPDRVVVEFDTRIDSELYENMSPPNDQFEGFTVYAQDKKANVGTMTVIGGNRTWSSPFSLWRAYFELDENNARQNGTADGTYKVTGTENPVQIKNNYTIDNIGDVHVKLVYDLNQKDDKGDVKLTAHITGDGLDYTTEQISALFSGYPDVAAITGLHVSARALSQYNLYNETTKALDIPVVKSKDTYIKNVNMYALQNDPDSIPDAELKVTDIVDIDNTPITDAAGLNEKEVYVTATITNNKVENEMPYVLVAAAYDKATNKLLAIDVSEAGTVAKGATSDKFEAELNLKSFKDGEAEIRVFAWNSLESATPLTEVNKPF